MSGFAVRLDITLHRGARRLATGGVQRAERAIELPSAAPGETFAAPLDHRDAFVSSVALPYENAPRDRAVRFVRIVGSMGGRARHFGGRARGAGYEGERGGERKLESHAASVIQSREP